MFFRLSNRFCFRIFLFPAPYVFPSTLNSLPVIPAEERLPRARFWICHVLLWGWWVIAIMRSVIFQPHLLLLDCWVPYMACSNLKDELLITIFFQPYLSFCLPWKMCGMTNYSFPVNRAISNLNCSSLLVLSFSLGVLSTFALVSCWFCFPIMHCTVLRMFKDRFTVLWSHPAVNVSVTLSLIFKVLRVPWCLCYFSIMFIVSEAFICWQNHMY